MTAVLDHAAAIAVCWVIVAVIIAVPVGRMIRRRECQRPAPVVPATYPPPVPPSVNWLPLLPPVPPPAQPADWYCTDGLWRTETEAAAWVSETDGSLAEWLAVWPTAEEPLYVPREWVA